MTLTINGELRNLDSGVTISALLEAMHLTGKLVLVEINGHAIDRSDFLATELGEGDALEIVRMVGGG